MVAPTTVPGILLTGIHSARPVATAVAVGTLYSCTTHGLVYQSNGTAWTTWATLGGGAGGSSSLPKIVQIKTGGPIITSVTLDAAPVVGHTLLMFIQGFTVGDPTAVVSTNTTWTKIKNAAPGDGNKFSLWVGVVAGGAGGTVITITHTNSALAAICLEVTDTLTGTLGTSGSGAANTDIVTAAAVTAGRLVAIMGAVNADSPGYAPFGARAASTADATLGSVTVGPSGNVSISIDITTNPGAFHLVIGYAGGASGSHGVPGGVESANIGGTGTLGHSVTGFPVGVLATGYVFAHGNTVAWSGGSVNSNATPTGTSPNTEQDTLPMVGYNAGLIWGKVGYATGEKVYAKHGSNAGMLMIAEIT